MRNKTAVVRNGTLALVAVAGAIGVIGSSADQPEPKPATTDALETVVRDSISQLEQNLTDLTTQQRNERIVGEAAFSLPQGVSFSAPASFEAIESQIANLEADRRDRSLAASALEEPTLAWYEDGFFTSLMALDWQCAWLSTGVAQVDDGKMDDVAETVEILYSFASTEYVSSFPDYGTFLKSQVDPLLRGDSSGARSFLPNCSPSTRVD